jgi:quercetin dioxygenase-like cupin family protein
MTSSVLPWHLLALAFVLAHASAFAGAASAQEQIQVRPEARTWSPFPVFGRGSQMAVLRGSPLKPGLFVIHVRFPAQSMLPAHTHPIEHVVTVSSGTYYVGMGEKHDSQRLREFPSGSVYNVPANAPHFAQTKDEVVLQIIGIGPTATQRKIRERSKRGGEQ